MRLFRIMLSPILLPISLLYGLVVFIRNRFYDYGLKHSSKFDIPIICVGNITVGGTGKTPHVEYLINLLKSDFSIASLSRGYKRKTEGFILSTSESTDHEIGDEPRQIKKKFPEIHVAVDADRTNGIKQLLLHNPNINAILLDDAFQHRKVKPGLSILLVDYSRPLHRDFILPFGNLREHAFEKKRADIIVITKAPTHLSEADQMIFLNKLNPCSNQKVFFSTFSYGNLVPVFNHDNVIAVSDLGNPSILMISGIANPKPLKKYITENISKNIQVLEYSDHYNFKESDFKDIEKKFKEIDSNSKIIITTEKDAMRLQKFSNIANNVKELFFYIPIKVDFLNNQADIFNQQIIEYVRKN